MNIYHYAEHTGEFLRASPARLDPIEQKPLVPALATTEAPPDTGDREVAVFNDGAWIVVADWRGYRYWLDDGSEHEITAVSVEPPADALPEPPPPPPVPLEQLRDNAHARIAAAMDAELSAVVGRYPNTETMTWDRQLAESDLVLSGAADPDVPMIDAMIAANGRTRTEQAQRIRDRADNYIALSGDAAGRRQALADQIEAAYTAEDRTTLETIDWA